MAPFKALATVRRPRGQPSLYRPEYCGLVVELAKNQGLSLTAFAGFVGVNVDTVYEWRKCHVDFSDACSRAHAARNLWWELKMGRARKGAEVTASMFALKNISPNEWRDVKHTEHQHKLTVERLTDDELHAIAAGKQPHEAGTIDAEFSRVKD